MIKQILIAAALLIATAAHAQQVYDIDIEILGNGYVDYANDGPSTINGTLTLDDSNTMIGAADISAFSLTLCNAAFVGGGCAQTLTPSNATLFCSECLVRSGSELLISPNYTGSAADPGNLGFNIASDTDACGVSGNTGCSLGVYTNHIDSEYFVTGVSHNEGIASFGNIIVAVAAPEIDPASAVSGLTLLLGGLVVLRGRESRPRRRAGR